MDLQNMRQRLADNGYKNTAQRDAMFQVLKEQAGEHLSPEEIHETLLKGGTHVGIATIYRTLQIFDSLDIVHKLDFDGRAFRYEIAHLDEVHQHHHLLCNRCNTVVEIHTDMLEQLEENIEKEYDFEITNHTLKLYGVCAACRKKMQEENIE